MGTRRSAELLCVGCLHVYAQAEIRLESPNVGLFKCKGRDLPRGGGETERGLESHEEEENSARNRDKVVVFNSILSLNEYR